MVVGMKGKRKRNEKNSKVDEIDWVSIAFTSRYVWVYVYELFK